METYLAHHGILKMTWGVRRWQNKDGTLTEAGKIRYGRKMTAKRKAAARKAAQTKKKAAEAKRKEEAKRAGDEKAGKARDVTSMTDQEIRDFLARKDLEQRYLDAVTPKTIEQGESATKRFMTKFGSSLVDNLIKEASQKIAKDIVNGVLGSSNNGPGKNNKKSKKKDKSDEENDED